MATNPYIAAADKADHLANRLAIVDRGKVAVQGTPETLKRDLHGDSVTLELADGRPDEAARVVAELGDVD